MKGSGEILIPLPPPLLSSLFPTLAITLLIRKKISTGLALERLNTVTPRNNTTKDKQTDKQTELQNRYKTKGI